MIAGPSEILVIADKDNDPDWIAVDLLSQAEHDASAQSILVTDNAGFGAAVAGAIEARLEHLERRDIAKKSWQDHGAVITVHNLDEAVKISDRIAPEHLEICTTDAEGVAQKIRHAGAIFIGAWTLAKMTPAALAQIGPAAEVLAKSESLEAHGLSVRARLDKLNESS